MDLVAQDWYNMITVGYSTRKHNPEFIEYLKISSGVKNIEVIEKINTGNKSLSQTYNEILSESKNFVKSLDVDKMCTTILDSHGHFLPLNKGEARCG